MIFLDFPKPIQLFLRFAHPLMFYPEFGEKQMSDNITHIKPLALLLLFSSLFQYPKVFAISFYGTILVLCLIPFLFDDLQKKLCDLKSPMT